MALVLGRGLVLGKEGEGETPPKPFNDRRRALAEGAPVAPRSPQSGSTGNPDRSRDQIESKFAFLEIHPTRMGNVRGFRRRYSAAPRVAAQSRS